MVTERDGLFLEEIERPAALRQGEGGRKGRMGEVERQWRRVEGRREERRDGGRIRWSEPTG